MKKFSIAEALRYVAVGFVFGAYLYIYDKQLAVSLRDTLGEVAAIGAALAFGALTYVVYRGAIQPLDSTSPRRPSLRLGELPHIL